MKIATMKQHTLIRLVSTVLVCSVWLASNSSTTLAQPGLADLAKRRGIDFGFEISPENLGEDAFRSTLVREASRGTVTAYWRTGFGVDAGPAVDPANPAAAAVRGQYDFSRPDSVVAFCKQNRIKTWGHPLIWAKDSLNPDWVVQSPPELAEALMINHINTLLGHFGDDIRTWDVVNEAWDYTGALADCYWKRALGERYIEIAFAAAAAAQPNAKLIYNDFGMVEKDSRKFDAVIAMIQNLRAKGIRIDGIGWQCHLTANQILDPDFPLADRMKTIAAMGLENHITELDVVIPDRQYDMFGNPIEVIPERTAENLELQKQAYRKITEIFVAAPRAVGMTIWGVSDKQSWLGEQQFPLLFDRNFNKKPAYFGVQEGLAGDLSGYRIFRHAWLDGSPEFREDVRPNQKVDFSFDDSGADQPTVLLSLLDVSSQTYQILDPSSGQAMTLKNGQWTRPVRMNDADVDDQRQDWVLTHLCRDYYLASSGASNRHLQPTFKSRNRLLVGAGPWFLLGIWRIE